MDGTGTQSILVIGGTGKIGRRVKTRLDEAGFDTRVGSRGGEPPFAWEDRGTWESAIGGAAAVAVIYPPDITTPGAADAVRDFAATAVQNGVGRLVLLVGRGEKVGLEYELALQEAGVDWTALRCSWFAQNFSEGDWLHSVRAGVVALPVRDDVLEPFVDGDDIADVAFAALTEEGHTGQIYEVTGPQRLAFADAVAAISHATGLDVRFQSIPLDAYAEGMREHHVPEHVVELVSYLFSEVLDGSNAQVGDGVERALGRQPRSFADFVQRAAAAGSWKS